MRRRKVVMLTDEVRQRLIRIAIDNLIMAYTPYSNYPVSAALLTSTGETFTGVNIENAAYPVTICAERVAVFKAVSEGKRDFQAIAVVTKNGGTPCGSCRQVLAEFGLDTIVIIADKLGRIIMEKSVAELLPGAFQASDLVSE
jgi:cytidine deaminase